MVESLFFELLRDFQDTTRVKDLISGLSDPDWNRFFEILTNTALFPYCCDQLLKNKSYPIPLYCRDRIKNMYLLNLKRQGYLELELNEIWDEFGLKGIRAIPLKGPFLAHFLYSDLGLRRASADLDILVKQDEFSLAEEILKKRGYCPLVSEPFYSFRIQRDRQILYSRKDNNGECLKIELHLELRPQGTRKLSEDFFQDTMLLKTGERQIEFPSLENLLIYLSLLAWTTTELPELRYFFELHTLIKRFSSQINWKKLQEKISIQYKAVVFFALVVCRDLFNSFIPDSFLRAIRPNLFKCSLLGLWMNDRQLLLNTYRLRRYYFFTFWHYFVSSYLYSNGFFDGLRTSLKKVFLPRREIMFYYDKADDNPPLRTYLKRITRPFFHWRSVVN